MLNNATPFAADQTFLADRDGRDTYVVCLKGTFDVGADGTVAPAKAQVPVDHAPRPRDPATPSSLLADCDFDFLKPGTDVVLLGHAINPDPAGKGEVVVGLKLGPIEKRLRVTGERIWLHSAAGPVLSAPAPFGERPVIWENAFGGMDRGQPDATDWEERNPVGTGFATDNRGIEGLRAPSVLTMDGAYANWGDRPAPAGLGPVARHWLPRRSHAGTYDEAWQKTRAPLWARDLDPRFFMAAPADQQCVPHLRGGEEVRIVNMTPGGFLGFRLPGVRPYANIRIGRARQAIRMWLSTVAIHPGAIPSGGAQVVVSWLGALACQGKREKILSIDIWDKPLVRIPAEQG